MASSPASGRGVYLVLTGVGCRPAPGRGHDGLMRVVVTRIGHDGAMERRMVDTCAAGWSDGHEWEDLARRALVVPPPYRPVPGCRIFQVRVDGGEQVLVAEHDLEGPLLDLVTAVLAMGQPV